MSEASVTACRIVPGALREPRLGDRLGGLLADHHAFVWRSLRRLGVADSDVDDACQQVFLVAHRRLAEIAPASERSFLFQTVLRVAADWRRTHKRRSEQMGVDLLSVPDVGANPEELLDRQRARMLLDHVLGRLPINLRVVFVLFELEEMTMTDIATLSDIPPGTVASRLRRARQVFQEEVGKLTNRRGVSRKDRSEP
jgi:RNA polymerase sigma-70 factor (ECF subfamily)